MARTETADENALLVDALRMRGRAVFCNHFGLQLSFGRRCSPSRQEPFAETRLKIFALGRMNRREERSKIVRGRKKCVTCKTDTNRLVTLRGCNTAASFGLSDLAQTSEQLHKQFELHFKQLTAS